MRSARRFDRPASHLTAIYAIFFHLLLIWLTCAAIQNREDCAIFARSLGSAGFVTHSHLSADVAVLQANIASLWCFSLSAVKITKDVLLTTCPTFLNGLD